jgi:hypothetical protein
MLGLEVAPDGSAVTFDPLLPEDVDRFEARGLRVGRGTIDVRIARVGGRVSVSDVQASGVQATAG